MKTTRLLGIALIFISLVFAFSIANFRSVASAHNSGAASLSQHITPTPTAKDASEIGSTDGILIMGFVITLIIIAPILFRRKEK
jgi:hypothetical protein